MSQSYIQIRNEYIKKAWMREPHELAECLPAEFITESYRFKAFGEECILTAEGVELSGQEATGPEGLLIAMYAASVPNKPVQLNPLKSFKELPNSMPYQSAFAANAERVLIPYAQAIQLHEEKLATAFQGHANPDALTGDFSFTLYPLPRIPLYYIFHLPDEEFPASASCLFAANAIEFMPLDGLADVAEYTSRKMISMVGGRSR
jgi:hypothetical protein